jgi:hypothetical protein
VEAVSVFPFSYFTFPVFITNFVQDPHTENVSREFHFDLNPSSLSIIPTVHEAQFQLNVIYKTIPHYTKMGHNLKNISHYHL